MSRQVFILGVKEGNVFWRTGMLNELHGLNDSEQELRIRYHHNMVDTWQQN